MKRQPPLSPLALVIALPLLATALLAGAAIRAMQLVFQRWARPRARVNPS